ncbi:MAG: NADPH dehydrogenase NamA [Tissierellaceae bacterium]|nr:NADPH dehydrogenase NamA [Tissierellaceae bacterium]
MKTFTSFKIKNMDLINRIVMPPMCMYSADENGFVNNFHRNHYRSRAIAQVGLIIVEATAVMPNGRISNADLGIWSDEHIEGLRSIVENVKEYDTKIGIQLAHAGRKSDSGDEFIVAPSSIRHSDEYQVPREISKSDIKDLIIAFENGARRANEAGFDTIEIHAAHGYLIHEFLSPITNKRQDEYGGSLENRVRFLKEIINSIKNVWPKEKPILVRVSADDYVEGGINKEEMVKIVNLIKDDVDIIHVSSGGLVSVKINVYPGYQVSHSDTIKTQCNVPTIAVGLIDSYSQSEEILGNNRADLIAFGRALLRNPYLPLQMAYDNNIEIEYPIQYKRGFR